MKEIGGDGTEFHVPILLAFKTNEVACMIMCFGHVEFVDFACGTTWTMKS